MAHIDVLVPGDGQKESSEMDANKAIELHCLNGAQRQADSATLYAEDARRNWLNAQSQMTQTAAVATRHLTGPHPQYGSPDK